MTHRYLILLLLPMALLGMACSDNCERIVYRDASPPLPPVGIVSVSLDNAVELFWIENQEASLAGYNVYVSHRYDGKYDFIGKTKIANFIDRGARNGFTYYYAVTAFDIYGNESALSRDVVYDTPRPEGRNVQLIDRFINPSRAGYDFSNYAIVHYDTDRTDFFFEIAANGFAYLVVWDDTDIQGMGYTETLDDISVAPLHGWNPSGDALAVKGHTYVIRTFDNHFAKIRIIDITGNAVYFDWAYQLVEGNRELLTGTPNTLGKRTRYGNTHPERRIASTRPD